MATAVLAYYSYSTAGSPVSVQCSAGELGIDLDIVVHHWGTPTDIVLFADRDVLIAGERFLVEREDGQVFLTHPQWSLLGAGATTEQARADLLAAAKELAEVLDADHVANLSPEAERLRAFVRRVL